MKDKTNEYEEDVEYNSVANTVANQFIHVGLGNEDDREEAMESIVGFLKRLDTIGLIK